MSKIVQSVELLVRILGLKARLPIMKMCFNHWLKVFLIPSGLTTAATTAGIHQKYFGWNNFDNFKQKNGRYHENF